MSQLKLYKGAKSSIPATYKEGALYVATDTNEMFLDVNSSTRIQISNIVVVATMTALNAIVVPLSTAYYYVTEKNQFYKYVNNAWECLGKRLTALIVGNSASSTSNTTTNTNGTVYMNLVIDGTVVSSHLVKGTGNAKVTSPTAGVINILASSSGSGGGTPTVVYDTSEPNVTTLGLAPGDVWINCSI